MAVSPQSNNHSKSDIERKSSPKARQTQSFIKERSSILTPRTMTIYHSHSKLYRFTPPKTTSRNELSSSMMAARITNSRSFSDKEITVPLHAVCSPLSSLSHPGEFSGSHNERHRSPDIRAPARASHPPVMPRLESLVVARPPPIPSFRLKPKFKSLQAVGNRNNSKHRKPRSWQHPLSPSSAELPRFLTPPSSKTSPPPPTEENKRPPLQERLQDQHQAAASNPLVIIGKSLLGSNRTIENTKPIVPKQHHKPRALSSSSFRGPCLEPLLKPRIKHSRRPFSSSTTQQENRDLPFLF